MAEMQSVAQTAADSGAAAAGPAIKLKEGQALRENLLEFFRMGPHCGISLAFKDAGTWVPPQGLWLN